MLSYDMKKMVKKLKVIHVRISGTKGYLPNSWRILAIYIFCLV